MKKLDFLFFFLVCLILIPLIHPTTVVYYKSLNNQFPYWVGFLKFFLLATFGELLSIRILGGNWHKPAGLLAKAFVWGFLGMVIVLIFSIFNAGISASLSSGLLPFAGSKLSFAFFTSLVMNLTFAPTFMAFHRITDTYIELFFHRKKCPTFALVVDNIDWKSFLSFVVRKTIPLFWIPAHTVTFLLPPEYRIVNAAFLSVALGGILSFSAKRK